MQTRATTLTLGQFAGGHWLYDGAIVDKAPKDFRGFVFEIECLSTGKKIIDSYRFWNRRKTGDAPDWWDVKYAVKESDWRNHFSNAEHMLEYLESHGQQVFKREIIYLAETQVHMDYYRVKACMERDALTSDNYLNHKVACKISCGALGHPKPFPYRCRNPQEIKDMDNAS